MVGTIPVACSSDGHPLLPSFLSITGRFRVQIGRVSAWRVPLLIALCGFVGCGTSFDADPADIGNPSTKVPTKLGGTDIEGDIDSPYGTEPLIPAIGLDGWQADDAHSIAVSPNDRTLPVWGWSWCAASPKPTAATLAVRIAPRAARESGCESPSIIGSCERIRQDPPQPHHPPTRHLFIPTKRVPTCPITTGIGR